MTVYEKRLKDLVSRLRGCKVSAPPEHPVHPQVCTEAADFLEGTMEALIELGVPCESIDAEES